MGSRCMRSTASSAFDRFRSKWRYYITCQEFMDGAK
jgi:hypothetical protein